MPDFAAIMKQARPRETTVTLYLAGDVAAELERLEAQYAETVTWEPDSLAAKHPGEAIAAKIKGARKKLTASATDFRLRALGDEAWSDLVAAHPSTDPNQRWDPLTFPRALVSACAIEPAMTPQQVTELFAVLNAGQREQLETGAYDVNASPTSIPFSLAASAIRAATTDGN